MAVLVIIHRRETPAWQSSITVQKQTQPAIFPRHRNASRGWQGPARNAEHARCVFTVHGLPDKGVPCFLSYSRTGWISYNVPRHGLNMRSEKRLWLVMAVRVRYALTRQYLSRRNSSTRSSNFIAVSNIGTDQFIYLPMRETSLISCFAKMLVNVFCYFLSQSLFDAWSSMFVALNDRHYFLDQVSKFLPMTMWFQSKYINYMNLQVCQYWLLVEKNLEKWIFNWNCHSYDIFA